MTRNGDYRWRLMVQRGRIGYNARLIRERLQQRSTIYVEPEPGTLIDPCEWPLVAEREGRELSDASLVKRSWGWWSRDTWGGEARAWRPTRSWAGAAARRRHCRRQRRRERSLARAEHRARKNLTIYLTNPCGKETP